MSSVHCTVKSIWRYTFLEWQKSEGLKPNKASWERLCCLNSRHARERNAAAEEASARANRTFGDIFPSIKTCDSTWDEVWERNGSQARQHRLAINALSNSGCRRISEVAKIIPRELLKNNGLGPKRLAMIHDFLYEISSNQESTP